MAPCSLLTVRDIIVWPEQFERKFGKPWSTENYFTINVDGMCWGR